MPPGPLTALLLSLLLAPVGSTWSGSVLQAEPVAAQILQNLVRQLAAVRREAGLSPLEQRAALDSLADRRARQVAALPPEHRLLGRPGPLNALLHSQEYRGYRRVAEHLDIRQGNRSPAEFYHETWRVTPEVEDLTHDPGMVAFGLALLHLPGDTYILSALFQEDPLTRSDAAGLEERAVGEVNRIRAKRGLSALQVDERLTLVARAYSQRMAREGFFDHVSPEGRTTADRVRRAGIPYRRLAENLQFNDAPDPVANALRSWLDSEGHRANLFDPRLTRTGVGVAISDDGVVYFTQLFLLPR
jgi:uncharacterized protein YkwD